MNYYYILLNRKMTPRFLLIMKFSTPKKRFLCPPLKKEEHIALHMSVGMSVGRYVGMSVGMSVSLNFVQLITQQCFAQEASNLVGR